MPEKWDEEKRLTVAVVTMNVLLILLAVAAYLTIAILTWNDGHGWASMLLVGGPISIYLIYRWIKAGGPPSE